METIRYFCSVCGKEVLEKDEYYCHEHPDTAIDSIAVESDIDTDLPRENRPSEKEQWAEVYARPSYDADHDYSMNN